LFAIISLLIMKLPFESPKLSSQRVIQLVDLMNFSICFTSVVQTERMQRYTINVIHNGSKIIIIRVTITSCRRIYFFFQLLLNCENIWENRPKGTKNYSLLEQFLRTYLIFSSKLVIYFFKFMYWKISTHLPFGKNMNYWSWIL
jgi:hypothetical protein